MLLCCSVSGCGKPTIDGKPAIDSPLTEVDAPATPQPSTTKAVEPSPPAREVRKQVVKVAKPVVEAQAVAGATVAQAGIPPVMLTTEHSALCRVRVGDSFPQLTLPQLNGGETSLGSLQGKRGTVVLFWRNDAWMSKTALEDLANMSDTHGIAFVGIAVNLTNAEVQPIIDEVGAEFPQFVDADGKAFNQVGMARMPRVYVLNESGEILWFDIEYSQSTKRELEQTLAVLAGDK